MHHQLGEVKGKRLGKYDNREEGMATKCIWDREGSLAPTVLIFKSWPYDSFYDHCGLSTFE